MAYGDYATFDDEQYSWMTGGNTAPSSSTTATPTSSSTPSPDPTRSAPPNYAAPSPYQTQAPGGQTTAPTNPYSQIDAAYRQYLGRTGSQQEYQSHLGSPGGTSGAITTIQNSPEARGYRTVSGYQNALTQLSSITDPAQWATRYDQLSRDVFNNLKAAGHDVKWQGETLLVDGRAYTINAGAQPGGGAASADPQQTIMGLLQGHAPSPQALAQVFPEIQKLIPGARLSDSDEVHIPGVGLVDLGQNFEGGGPMAWQWLVGNGAGGGGAAAQSASAVKTPTGAPLSFEPTIADPALTGWRPGEHTYTPGEIPELDLGFSFEQLLGGGAVDEATEQALRQLLENPSALDDRAVSVLQAANKAESAALFDQEQRDLEALGHQLGIDDSRWIEAEKFGARRDRDAAIMAGNRDIEMQAAMTRKDDQRKAIELGTSYGATQTQRRVAAAAPVLQQAALSTDRLQLREAVKQEAAKIGLSADALMSEWLGTLLDDLVAREGLAIDRAQLQAMTQQQKEELAFRYAQLSEQGRQYDLNYGLDFANLQHQVDQDHWNRYAWMNDPARWGG